MEVRRAVRPDIPAMIEVMFAAPSREAVAVVGTVDRARRFQHALLERARVSDAGAVFVAVDGDTVVGFAVVSSGNDAPPTRDLVSIAVRSMGWRGALMAGWRSRTRSALEFDAPPGGRHLVELQVDPTQRGQGTGGRLLDAVEEYARAEQAAHVSLTTGSTNPARRLYERHGYELVDERSDARYERLTGVPGRVLLVKPLS
jgi:ribosomal protein S18 acetylase RimI-like enzyme